MSFEKKLFYKGVRVNSFGIPLFLKDKKSRVKIKNRKKAFYNTTFISPFLEKLNTLWQIDKVNETFYKTNFNFGKIKKLIPVSIVIYSDNDPYVGRKLMEKLIINGGHFNKKAGFEKFPQLLKLCLK